mmetsp:Transcript_49269/g.106037  ORF Transcript_49269/g.106037 Transcript_49269/m.106037 type:complete len:237 (+) Transcript_49269:37-747(+)
MSRINTFLFRNTANSFLGPLPSSARLPTWTRGDNGQDEQETQTPEREAKRRKKTGTRSGSKSGKSSTLGNPSRTGNRIAAHNKKKEEARQAEQDVKTSMKSIAGRPEGRGHLTEDCLSEEGKRREQRQGKEDEEHEDDEGQDVLVHCQIPLLGPAMSPWVGDDVSICELETAHPRLELGLGEDTRYHFAGRHQDATCTRLFFELGPDGNEVRCIGCTEHSTVFDLIPASVLESQPA